MVKGNVELLAGLHQPEHNIAGDATVEADGSTRDLSLGDEGTNIVLRRIGVQRNLRMFQHLEQFLLAPMEAHKQLVKCLIADGQREDTVESSPVASGCPRRWMALSAL